MNIVLRSVRDIFFSGQVYTGCRNDLHLLPYDHDVLPVRRIEGRIIWYHC
jgi:hypothetical protein